MILITGGGGFIGSALARELNRRGRRDIFIVDRLGKSEKWKNLRNIKYEGYLHVDDFLEGQPDMWIEEKVDFIFHLGACSSTTVEDMDYLFRNNVHFSQGLFTLALTRDIPFVYASSAATYGRGEKGFSDDPDLVEDLRPLNPYGYSKQVFDEWILNQKDGHSHWFGLKFFNVYGPNEYHKGQMRSMVHKGYEEISEQGQLRLFKSHREDFDHGEQKRDFIYIKDVLSILVELMAEEKAALSGLYNLGTGRARSFNEMAHALFSALGEEPQIEYFDMPRELRDQYQYYTEADLGRFRKVFPDFEFTSLEEGVEDYIQNYLETEDPYL